MAAYTFTSTELTKTLEEQFDSEAAILTSLYSDAGLEAVVEELDQLDALNFEHNRLTLLTGSMGQPISGNVENVDWDGSGSKIDVSQVTFSAPSDIEASKFTMREIPLGPNHLILGISSHFEEQVLEALGLALVTGFLAILLTSAGVGVLVGRRNERQLLEMTRTLSFCFRREHALAHSSETVVSREMQNFRRH